jgi:hypothetical protein
MGLAMRYADGKYYPEITCDTCCKPIADWQEAIATHPASKGCRIVPVTVYHKGECDPGSRDIDETQQDILEQIDILLQQGNSKLWQELTHFLPWLMWNHRWGIRQHGQEKDRLSVEVPRPSPIDAP